MTTLASPRFLHRYPHVTWFSLQKMVLGLDC